MKASRLLVFAFVSALLPILPAADKPEAPSPPAVQVTVKRTKQPSGEKLNAVSTTSALLNGDSIQGGLSVNVGTAAQPRYWIVNYDAEGDGVIHIEVSDAGQLIHGTREGTSWVSPVELFEVHAPFSGSGTVTIYKTDEEVLTLDIAPVTAPVEKTPEAK